MRRKRLCAAISAAVMCVSMLGNVPMVSMAQESARAGVEAEAEATVATDSDAGSGAGVEVPETGDEVEATTQEEVNELLYSPVKVTYKGKVLKEGTDYTLKGNGRKAVGTSWAVVTGTGNYTGTIKVKYAMKKASQSKMIVYTKDARAVDAKKKGATVQLVASSVRDGAKITYSVEKPNQGITVSQDGKVTVKKGTKPGKYRIKVLAESTPYYKATSKYFTVVVK